jgi:single-strand DNA-binding protein
VNQPQITLSGNVAAAPSLRLAGGTPVTSFRVGATPRRHDKATDSWSDAETLWFTVTAWRGLAEHCVASLAKGDKVVVSGRLTQKTWTADDGTARPGLEVEAASVGLDLARTNALALRKNPGGRGAEDTAVEPADSPVESTDGDVGEDDGAWMSTGQVDLATGEVEMVRAESAEREAVGV